MRYFSGTMKIEIQGVSKSYGKLRALDHVQMEIAPGQIVAVLGQNGAGKTTLLRTLAGLVAPDQGQFLCDDQSFRRDRVDLRRQIFFLPDFPFYFTDMTIIRHIGMILNVYEAAAPGVEERVLEILRDFDLLPLAETQLAFLSRGQLYKTALAALLAVDPAVWLLDEPFASGMDPHGFNSFKQHARAAAQRGRTILYTTQILDVAERFSDRVCVVHQGEIRAFDSVANLRAKTGAPGEVLEGIFQQLREERPS